MIKENPHWGTSLDTFLNEDGIREAANAAVVTRVVAWQIRGQYTICTKSHAKPRSERNQWVLTPTDCVSRRPQAANHRNFPFKILSDVAPKAVMTNKPC